MLAPCWCFRCVAARRARRRKAVKAGIMVATVVAACALPLLSLSTFLYLCGAVSFVIGLVALGMALELWRGFRRFERWTGEQAERLTRKPFVKLVRR